MIVLHQANRLEKLSDCLARELLSAESGADPLRSELVVVSNPGTGRWLVHRLAEQQGVMANDLAGAGRAARAAGSAGLCRGETLSGGRRSFAAPLPVGHAHRGPLRPVPGVPPADGAGVGGGKGGGLAAAAVAQYHRNGRRAPGPPAQAADRRNGRTAGATQGTARQALPVRLERAAPGLHGDPAPSWRSPGAAALSPGSLP